MRLKVLFLLSTLLLLAGGVTTALHSPDGKNQQHVNDNSPELRQLQEQENDKGNPVFLLNTRGRGALNTEKASETVTQRSQRWAGLVPDGNIAPEFDPLETAKCFNEVYTVPTSLVQMDLYNDYVKVFEWGFNNNMGQPLQAVSEENNGVTNNRFPSMMLRMAFHDNSINTGVADFQVYVKSSLKSKGDDLLWTGPGRYLQTSGADASVLLCPEERYHPNQNYDQSASRVLFALQHKFIPGLGGKSMVEKYKLSYSDLLQNGALAAAIYLTDKKNDPQAALKANPMQFGRKDACYKRSPSTRGQSRMLHNRFALCGPTELLPGIALDAKQLNGWFVQRGMNECLWMALMWTHTTMDNMAFECPLMKLPATTTQADVNDFQPKDRLYFQAGDTLDYFEFFLTVGEHVVQPTLDDPEAPNCDWFVNDRKEPWPLTRTDCTLGLDNVERYSGLQALKDAINKLHTPGVSISDILMCSLNMLGGSGTPEDCKNIQVDDPMCILDQNHQFGAFYG